MLVVLASFVVTVCVCGFLQPNVCTLIELNEWKPSSRLSYNALQILSTSIEVDRDSDKIPSTLSYANMSGRLYKFWWTFVSATQYLSYRGKSPSIVGVDYSYKSPYMSSC